ncbi:MAG: hypothetical protein RR288_04165 [Oscillibacter sp.]
MKPKNGLLLFLSTCIPGCGQMYQGYMKRGVSLLAAFCALMGLSIFLNLGELCIFLPLIWLYAFYDSYNLHRQTEEQAAAHPDTYLFGLSDLDSEKIAELYRKKHSLIGWGLVVMGVYALYGSVVGQLMNVLNDYFELYWLQGLMLYTLPRIVATLLLIALGLWFIRGPKAAKAEEDDFTSFTPPVKPAEEDAAAFVAEVVSAAAETEDTHGNN